MENDKIKSVEEERLDRLVEERIQSKKTLVKDLVITASSTVLAAVFGTDFILQISQKTGNTARYLIDLGAASVGILGALSYGSFVQDDKQAISLQEAAIEEVSRKVK